MGSNLFSLLLSFSFLEALIKDIEDVLQVTIQNKMQAVEDKTAA